MVRSYVDTTDISLVNGSSTIRLPRRARLSIAVGYWIMTINGIRLYVGIFKG
jgi:hypothetical protein